MKNKFILTLLPIILLSACAKIKNNEDNLITVTDGIGRVVSLDPDKIT